MKNNEKLLGLRNEINDIDKEIIKLFEKRMEIVETVAETKKINNISISDQEREAEIVKNALGNIKEKFKGETEIFMRSVIAVSKMRQRQLLHGETDIAFPLSGSNPENVKVVYQGIAGAWGEQASKKLFPAAEIYNLEESFESVFKEVKEKKAYYGIIPIENSHTGAIGEVYDLLGKYGCYIVGQDWVDIKQCLMVNSNTKIEDIREVLSHPEGFKQCSNFLNTKAWDLTACKNTAVAAQIVADKKDKRFAAIGSINAAKIYGLKALDINILNDSSNRTRFIAICDVPVYTKESKTVSLKIITAHQSGALLNALFPFAAHNVNLSRIESRPIYGGKYGFFVDIEGNIEDENVKQALKMAVSECSYLEILGCY